MKIILNMAVSCNGYIADEKGSEEFLSDANWDLFIERAKKHKCIIWGRKTYEAVCSWDKKYINDLESVTKIIITRKNKNLPNSFFPASDPKEAIEVAQVLGYKSALLSGGARINSNFAILNLIDEVILDINPILLGKGLPLFLSDNFELNLKFKACKKMTEDILEVDYTVAK